MRPIECSGAPRDLGFDQGWACARTLASLCEQGVPQAARVARDCSRYYPHLAERGAGLARGARIARRLLADPLAAELGLARAPLSAGLALAIDRERSGSDGRIVRALRAPLQDGFELRRSRPDHGYRSLEVTLPWLASSLAGVNAAGLAATVVSLAAREIGPCAAPPLLLVQDCLQRFDTSEKALEWCLRRPSGGRAALLFGDAGGHQVGVLVDGARRRVLHPSEGLIFAMDGSEQGVALEKACRDALVLDGVTLERSFGESRDALVWLDPGRGRLGLLSGPTRDAEPDGVRFLPV